MASEVAILHWCDVDYAEGNKVEPTFTGTFSAGLQRNMKVELCDEHNVAIPLDQLEEFLAQYGTPDKDGAKLDKQAASQPRLPSTGGRPAAIGEHTCPVRTCDKHTDGYAARSSLISHTRQVHGEPLTALELRLGVESPVGSNYRQPMECPVPDCRRKDIYGNQGMGAHLRAAHPEWEHELVDGKYVVKPRLMANAG